MIDILNLYRFESLQRQYMNLKAEAKNLLEEGNIATYIKKLDEINKIRVQLVQSANEKCA